MPYKINKKDGKYRVASPHGVKAKKTTLRNATRQVRLLRGIKRGWKPSGKSCPGGKIRSKGKGQGLGIGKGKGPANGI